VDPYRDAPASAEPTQEQALAFAERVARRYFLSGRAFRRAVTEVESRVEELVRVLLFVERRRIVHDLVPAPDAAGESAGELPPLAGDPWAVDPEELARVPRVYAACPDCDGSGRGVCELCRGTARLICGRCGGGGLLIIGTSSRRCYECHGQGTTACACRTGRVLCDSCHSVGHVRARLGVARETLGPYVRFHPDGPLADQMLFLLEPESFDHAQGPMLVEDTGLVDGRPDLPETLRPPGLDPVLDRVQRYRRQRFAVDVHMIRYRVLGAPGELCVIVGSETKLWGESNLAPLARRRTALIASALAAVAGAAWVVIG
jgi:hypothetical protein